MKQQLAQGQYQKVIATQKMQKAFHVLQLPVVELSHFITTELQENPLLELSEETEWMQEELLKEFCPPKGIVKKEEDTLRDFIENTLVYESSLFDFLMMQANETFLDGAQREIAQVIIGNLDQNGFLSLSMEELCSLCMEPCEKIQPILAQIQQFEPPGVAARSLQESLQIQLKLRCKQDTLAYQIVTEHFHELLHNQLPQIAKKSRHGLDEVLLAIEKEIAVLNLHPGTLFNQGHYRQLVQTITPDVIVTFQDGKFSITVHEKSLPPLRFNPEYLKMLMDSSASKETKDYIQDKLLSGRWLLRNLSERYSTLYRIAEQLVEKESDFLIDAKGKLVPLTMKEIAGSLSLHESTIVRAVANKYLSCPRGVFPLRSFFTHAFVTEKGEEISAKTVKDLLCEIIQKENPCAPLSDEKISQLMKEKGVPCARRTVAKFRNELKIATQSKRRKH